MPYTARIIAVAVQIARIGAGLSFAVLIAAVTLQVVGRSVGRSPVWTEELTRFALLYLVAFGVGPALRTGDLVNVDVVCESLPGRWPWRLRLVAAAVTAGLAFWLAIAAWRFVTVGAIQTSPALGLRMDIVHFCIWLLLALLFLFAALRVFGMLAGTDRGTPRDELED